jgi:AhpD family alkylhydroperoxidase
MDIKTIEAMGMVVSADSHCEYCLQAHTFLGLHFAKLDMTELVRNRQGTSEDPKRATAVRFAKTIADTRGNVSDNDLAEMRNAGFTDADIVAIAGLTAQFLMTNFMNNIAQVELDFPTDERAGSEIPLASAWS